MGVASAPRLRWHWGSLCMSINAPSLSLCLSPQRPRWSHLEHRQFSSPTHAAFNFEFHTHDLIRSKDLCFHHVKCIVCLFYHDWEWPTHSWIPSHSKTSTRYLRVSQTGTVKIAANIKFNVSRMETKTDLPPRDIPPLASMNTSR